MLDFVKCFLSIKEDDHEVFVFEFVYIVDYVDGFPYIKPSLRPWDEAYLIMMNDHFDVFLVSFGENY